MNALSRLLLFCLTPLAIFVLVGCRTEIATTGNRSATSNQLVVGLVPTDLRCEYFTDPVGIDEPSPRLDWRLTGNPAVRGQVQSSCRILVASSAELLAQDRGDLWSTDVKSAATTQIAYAGRPLAAHEQAFWKVQVVDGAGHRSAWSAPARWSMGLLKAEAWQAQWIGSDQAKPSTASWLPQPQKRKFPPPTMLRKDFTLQAVPTRAVLYVTALGHVEPRLNGQLVADEYFTPGFTDYRKRLYYRAYDVTALLKPGANTLGAVLADGWFRGSFSMLGLNHYGRHTRLRAELHLFDAAGHDQVVASDTSWKAGFGPIVEADMQAGESYDAQLEQTGWDSSGFDDHAWLAVDTGADVTPAIIRSHPAPPVHRIGERPTLAITQPKPGVYVFDLGQNFAGYARLKVHAPAGTAVALRFAEMLEPDGTVYVKALRSARAIDTYVCKGGGEETWEPRLTYHGFRYVQVEGLTEAPTPATITGVVLSSGYADTGAFECSHALLNQIWSNTRWSQLSNYFEIPTDCPQRDEREGWLADTQVFVRTGSYNQDVAAFMNKWMDDVVDTQAKDGKFSATAPGNGRWSPGWADAGVIVPWTLWQVYGDIRVLERLYGNMQRHIEYYQAHSPELIGPEGVYGDWLAIGGYTEKSLIGTAYFAYSTKLMAEIAEALGKNDDAAAYRRLFADICAAFQKKFINADGSIGEKKSQTAHLMALHFDLLTPEQRAAAIPHLLKNFEDRNWRLGVGFLGVNLLLPTLSEIRHTDGAYYLMEGTEFPSWGYSIDQGATTIWERWNSYTKARGFGDVKMNSFNHYSYGSCVEWLYRTVLGISAAEPGYGRVIIRPEPGPGIIWARGHYDSIHGRITTDWKWANGQLGLDVTLPPNTSAEIYVPAAAAEAVREGGLPAASAPGLRLLRMEDGSAVFAAGSGEYRFSVPYTGPRLTVQPPVPGRSNAAEEENPAQLGPAAPVAPAKPAPNS